MDAMSVDSSRIREEAYISAVAWCECLDHSVPLAVGRRYRPASCTADNLVRVETRWTFDRTKFTRFDLTDAVNRAHRVPAVPSTDRLAAASP